MIKQKNKLSEIIREESPFSRAKPDQEVKPRQKEPGLQELRTNHRKSHSVSVKKCDFLNKLIPFDKQPAVPTKLNYAVNEYNGKSTEWAPAPNPHKLRRQTSKPVFQQVAKAKPYNPYHDNASAMSSDHSRVSCTSS